MVSKSLTRLVNIDSSRNNILFISPHLHSMKVSCFFLWYYSLMLQKKKKEKGERKKLLWITLPNAWGKCFQNSEWFVPELLHLPFLFMLFAYFCGARKQVKYKARWLANKQLRSPALKVAFMGMNPDVWAPPGIRDTGEGSPWHQTSSITQM